MDTPRVNYALGFEFLMPFLGWLFLPFTTLIYIILAPVNGPQSFDWVWLGIGVLLDLSTYAGSAYGNRDRMPGYTQRQ
jgi:hypothetical protein